MKLLITFLVLICVTAPLLCAAKLDGNIVVNGGFEAGQSGWNLHDRDHASYFTKFNAYEGLFAAELGPEIHKGVLSQILPTIAGQSYELSYELNFAGISTETGFSFEAFWEAKASSVLVSLCCPEPLTCLSTLCFPHSVMRQNSVLSIFILLIITISMWCVLLFGKPCLERSIL